MGIETLAAISIGAGIAGAVTGAVGSNYAGQAKSNAATYQMQVAQNNKIIADRNAQYALATGETEAQIMGMKTRAQIGQTRATQAAHGLDVNSGSNLAVRESEASIGSFNEMMIRSNAKKTAYGFEVEGVNQLNQAAISKMAAENAETEGYIGAASSLLGGASSVSDKWMKFGQQGVPGYA